MTAVRIAAAVLVMTLLPSGRRAVGQGRVSLQEINPNRSTLADPDGASGGRVNGIGSASDGSVFFAASEWGGLYRSTDFGTSWNHVPGYLPMATWDVAVDPADAARVYATSFYDGRVQSLSGIGVSTDGGNTWTRPSTTTPPVGFCREAARRTEPSAFGISIDPTDPTRVFVGTNCGLAISRDRGLTWSFVDPTPGDPAGDVWDVVVHHGGIIDVCGDDAHRRSTTGGATWTGATGSASLYGGGCSIAVSPDEPDVLFVVVGISLFESDNGGATWSPMMNPRSQGRIPFVATNRRAGNRFDLWFGDVLLSRATCTTAVPPATGGAPRCPTATWAGPFTRNVGAHDDAGDIAFDPTATVDACPELFASDGGVYRNIRAGVSPLCHDPVWTQPRVSPHALWLFSLGGADQLQTADADLYMGAQDNGMFATQFARAAPPLWVNTDCCDIFDIAADPYRVAFTQCCRGGQAGIIVATPGILGKRAIVGPPGRVRGFSNIPALDLFGPDDAAAVTTMGLFLTQSITSNPTIWSGPLGGAASPAALCNVKASGTGAAVVFYAQNTESSFNQCQELFPDVRRLWRFVGTPTNGTWWPVSPPRGLGGFGVFDVDPGDPTRLIAAHLVPPLPPAMVMSTTGGATWTSLTALDNLMTGGGAFQYANLRGPTNFTNFYGYGQPTLVAFDPADRGVIVAGAADAGLFMSLDSGTTWQRVTDPFDPAASGVPHLPRPRFAYFYHGVRERPLRAVTLFVGTQGRGVWRVTVERDEIAFGSNRPPDPTAPGVPFATQPDTWVANSSGLSNVTRDANADGDPAWSPDGSRIAFATTRPPDPATPGGPFAPVQSDIWVMNADGTGLVNLTKDPYTDSRPAWSPDGSRIVFVSTRPPDPAAPGGPFAPVQPDIWVMNADGTGLVNLTNDPYQEGDPAWSPDGARIAFASTRPPDPNTPPGLPVAAQPDIWVMNADGTGLVNLTNDLYRDSHPTWSPDGSRIAFASTRPPDPAAPGGPFAPVQPDIWVMNAGGTGLVNLTQDAFSDEDPAWSPDGSRIAFASTRPPDRNAPAGPFGPVQSDIWIMNTDGTGLVNITVDLYQDARPVWAPNIWRR